MEQFALIIHSDIEVQKELHQRLKRRYPHIRTTPSSEKSFDAFQTITLAISGAALLTNIMNLILATKIKHPSSTTHVEITSMKSSKTLRISTTMEDVKVEEMIAEFLGGK